MKTSTSSACSQQMRHGCLHGCAAPTACHGSTRFVTAHVKRVQYGMARSAAQAGMIIGGLLQRQLQHTAGQGSAVTCIVDPTQAGPASSTHKVEAAPTPSSTVPPCVCRVVLCVPCHVSLQRLQAQQVWHQALRTPHAAVPSCVGSVQPTGAKLPGGHRGHHTAHGAWHGGVHRHAGVQAATC